MSPAALRKAYTPRPLGPVPAVVLHTRSTMGTQSIEQKSLSRHLILYYNAILLGVVALLAVRHLSIMWGRRRKSQLLKKEILEQAERREDKFGVAQGEWWREKREIEEALVAERRQGRWGRAERWATSGLRGRWYWCGLANPLQVGIVVLVTALNVAFVLWGTVVYVGEETAADNHIHSAALRCGYMSVAQFPLIFALTSRNNLVSRVTGIEYYHLRFAHKLLALFMALLGVIHTVDATVAETKWFGGAGVAGLYLHNYLGQTGLVMIAGLLCILIFSIRAMRTRFYELFIATHVLGALLMLIGLFYHIPALREWVWAPIGIWAFERTARLLQLVSIHLLARLNLRSPLRKANAALVDGAIILRVPFKGSWTSGQHAYLSFPGLAIGQSHPFSIANVPSELNATGEADTHEMLFVMGVRGGVTATIAAYLDGFSSKSAELTVAVEGPYAGGESDVKHYEDILFVGGGTGITHLSSMMADAVLKASKSKSRTTRIKLIWTIQSMGQSSWVINELLDIAKRAHIMGVAISIDFHVTRGPLNSLPSSTLSSAQPTRNNSVADLDELINRAPNRNNSIDSMASFESFESLDSLYHPRPNFFAHSRRASVICGEDHLDLLLDAGAAAAIHKGRPRLPQAIAAFVESAGKSTLVVVCGPPKMAKQVAFESTKLAATHPVDLNVAVFEC